MFFFASLFFFVLFLPNLHDFFSWKFFCFSSLLYFFFLYHHDMGFESGGKSSKASDLSFCLMLTGLGLEPVKSVRDDTTKRIYAEIYNDYRSFLSF